MTKICTEIFLNKTIEIFKDNGYFIAKIDGEILVPRGGGVSDGKHRNITKAITSAKLSIRKNITKADKIAELQAMIAKLENE